MSDFKRFAVVGHGVPQADSRAAAEEIAAGLVGGSPSQPVEVYERCSGEQQSEWLPKPAAELRALTLRVRAYQSHDIHGDAVELAKVVEHLLALVGV